MNAIDEYDIREVFDALDLECTGRLSFSELQTLYLGLGFSSPRRMTEEILRKDAKECGLLCQDSLSLEDTLKLFKKYSRDRSSELEEAFFAFNSNRKKYLTADDIVRVSAEVGEPVSKEYAVKMLALASGGECERIHFKDFMKIFAPPEP